MSKNLNKGAFIVSRSIFDSEIWFAPAEYLKVWIYLIGKANHETRTYNGYLCERGQYFCDYKEIARQLTTQKGFILNDKTTKTVKNVFYYLRTKQMISTAKKPRGVLITLLNYDTYQTLESYEKTNGKTNDKSDAKPQLNQEGPSINKNYQELEELKPENQKKEIPENLKKDYSEYLKLSEEVTVTPGADDRAKIYSQIEVLVENLEKGGVYVG